MAIIAEFRVRAPDLLLGSTFGAVPEMRVEVEQHTAGESGLPIFFFWADGGDFDAFDAALAADATVGEFVVLDERDDAKLYRVKFAEVSFYQQYRDAEAKILELQGDRDGWYVRIRFPDRERFLQYRSAFTPETTFRLDRLYSEEELRADARFDLTPAQRETLVLAFREGYFEEPRETSLDALAEQLGVSPQAVSGRLRRGLRTLVADTLVEDPDPPSRLLDFER